MDGGDGVDGGRRWFRCGCGVRGANVQFDSGVSAGGPQITQLVFIGGG